MNALQVGSVVRMSVVVVLMAFVIKPNAANAVTMRAIPGCQPAPIHDQYGHKCWARKCVGWNSALKCCYKWTCSIVH
jgi:hypothetical protein